MRYPKGAVVEPIPAVETHDGVDVVARHDAVPATTGKTAATRKVLLVGVGSMTGTAMAAGEALAAHGLDVTVVSPTWVLPMPSALVKLTGEHDLVVTIEDGLADGGVGSLLGQRAVEAGVTVPVVPLGLPTVFLDHMSIDQVKATHRLTAQDVTRDALTALALL